MTTDDVMVKLSVLCDDLGFKPPPVEVHARFFPVGDRWAAHVWTPEDPHDRVLGWLAEALNLEAVGDPPGAPSWSLAAPDLPPPLEQLERNVNVGVIVFRRNGDVGLTLQGSRSKIREQLALLDERPNLDEVVSTDPPGSDPGPPTPME